MSPGMGDSFREVVRERAGEPQLRAAIVRGAGATFSIGGLRDMRTRLGDDSLSFEERRTFLLGCYDRG